MIQAGGALALIAFATSISFAIFTMLKRQKRFRIGIIYEITGLDALTREQVFDELLTVETLGKVEAR